MKNLFPILSLFAVTTFLITSCSNSSSDKAQESVKSYLKTNLKNPESYEPISFSGLDTLKQPDTSESKQVSPYKITHDYYVTNSGKDKVKMSISFYLGKELQVNRTNTKSIHGEYGSLSGIVIWEYNNAGGTKPDAGAEITLFSTEFIQNSLKYETTADTGGHYKLEKIPPGTYFLMTCSKNSMNCPEQHIQKLTINSPDMKKLFGFDIHQYQAQLDQINKLDSEYRVVLFSNDFDKYGGLFKMVEVYTVMQREIRARAERLIESFPEKFRKEIKLTGGYCHAYDFKTIEIIEGKTETHDPDFGTTCVPK